MKIHLVQVDGKLPNLALMRLSAWHKAKGDSVSFHDWNEKSQPAADVVYASSIFSTSASRRAEVKRVFPNAIVGGDGFKPVWSDLTIIGRNVGSNLSEVIKDCNPNEISPDYSFYPNFAASLGYTQRGCRLDCAFCRMKTREGEARNVSSLHAIWRGPGFPKHIHLLDNDFFGQAEWHDILKEAITEKFKVCFNQGINIRLINEEQATVLSKVFYANDSFERRMLYTAWDNLGDEKVFKAGVKTLVDAGIPAHKLMVYMLVGFRKGETLEEVFHRFNELVALGCRPYPMVFDTTRRDLKKFQRWVIRRYYKVVSWENFDPSYKKEKHVEKTLEMV